MLKEDGDVRWISPLGFLLSILGLIFWKLDQRNRRLVKNGEAALAFLDSQHDLAQQNGAPHVLKIFELAEFRPSATFHLLRRTRQPVTETVLRSRIGGALFHSSDVPAFTPARANASIEGPVKSPFSSHSKQTSLSRVKYSISQGNCGGLLSTIHKVAPSSR